LSPAFDQHWFMALAAPGSDVAGISSAPGHRLTLDVRELGAKGDGTTRDTQGSSRRWTAWRPPGAARWWSRPAHQIHRPVRPTAVYQQRHRKRPHRPL